MVLLATRLTASVIVRAKDKADTIGATLQALRDQTLACEIIVVDSGSQDSTVAIARRYADRVIEIRPETFTYGRALNIGAAAANGDIHFALSAHCIPERDSWIEESLELYALGDRIAGTNQADVTPYGVPIEDYYVQTLEDAYRAPSWGFSNHASSWRADVWRELPFREDLAACEDKEWSWRVLQAGWQLAFSPRLGVPSRHRRGQGPVQLHRRVATEGRVYIELGAARPLSAGEALRAWWSSFAPGGDRSPVLRRLSPYRMVEILGAWSAGREAAKNSPAIALFRDSNGGEQMPTRPPFLPWS